MPGGIIPLEAMFGASSVLQLACAHLCHSYILSTPLQLLCAHARSGGQCACPTSRAPERRFAWAGQPVCTNTRVAQVLLCVGHLAARSPRYCAAGSRHLSRCQARGSMTMSADNRIPGVGRFACRARAGHALLPADSYVNRTQANTVWRMQPLRVAKSVPRV